ncbi:hypothetical protein H4Q26_009826 [Puccinia striiformis f. sp. tritici PST-130]|nr:hypothetical protein H4Q26_009826 [Puccinia striiformis f. sp. tritici PST-130]
MHNKKLLDSSLNRIALSSSTPAPSLLPKFPLPSFTPRGQLLAAHFYLPKFNFAIFTSRPTCSVSHLIMWTRYTISDFNGTRRSGPDACEEDAMKCG